MNDAPAWATANASATAMAIGSTSLHVTTGVHPCDRPAGPATRPLGRSASRCLAVQSRSCCSPSSCSLGLCRSCHCREPSRRGRTCARVQNVGDLTVLDTLDAVWSRSSLANFRGRYAITRCVPDIGASWLRRPGLRELPATRPRPRGEIRRRLTRHSVLVLRWVWLRLGNTRRRRSASAARLVRSTDGPCPFGVPDHRDRPAAGVTHSCAAASHQETHLSA